MSSSFFTLLISVFFPFCNCCCNERVSIQSRKITCINTIESSEYRSPVAACIAWTVLIAVHSVHIYKHLTSSSRHNKNLAFTFLPFYLCLFRLHCCCRFFKPTYPPSLPKLLYIRAFMRCYTIKINLNFFLSLFFFLFVFRCFRIAWNFSINKRNVPVCG